MRSGRLPEALFMVFLSDSKSAKVLRPEDACQKRFSWFSIGFQRCKALFMIFRLDSKGAKVCKTCRNRQELSNGYKLDPNSNGYLIAQIGFDTAGIPSFVPRTNPVTFA